jgi:hypothetical protein
MRFELDFTDKPKEDIAEHKKAGENSSLNKEALNSINDIQKMDSDTKSDLFNIIDTYKQNFKTKQAFAK